MTAFEAPPDLTISSGKHLLATIICLVVWLGVAGWAVRLARQDASAMPFLMLAGGGLAYGFEPLVDNLGKCWLPEDYQWTLFSAFDRDMPLYGLFVYSAFFGGFAMTSWHHLKTGGAPRGLWKKFAIAMLINTFLFETPATALEFYTYYGDQPWDFWGFPLWWPFVNTAGPLIGGALAYVLDDVLRLPPKVLYPTAFVSEPIFDGLSNGGAGLPTWAALHSGVSTPVVWVLGTVTMATSCLLIFGTVKALERIQAAQSWAPHDGRRLPGRLPAEAGVRGGAA